MAEVSGVTTRREATLAERPLDRNVRRLPRTVVADPPWWPSLHRNTVGRREGPYRAGPQRYYPLLTVEQIEAMRPETEPKAHLYLWALNQHLDWAVRVARAWGFEPQQTLTWCKPGYGTGQFQCNSEQVLLCRKGGPAGNAFGKTRGTWFQWPRGRHSEKPEEFYELVERVSPGDYHEMFARRVREGWTAMGNEVTGVLETPNPMGLRSPRLGGDKQDPVVGHFNNKEKI